MSDIFDAIKSGNIHSLVLQPHDDIQNMRKFHNFIKLSLLETYRSKTLLDIAVGRGGDLYKWKKTGFKTVIGFDPHEPSIHEAKKRFLELLKTNTWLPFTKYLTLDVLDKNINTKVENTEKQVRGLHEGMYDVVSCQFAFHYFTGTDANLHHVLSFISSKLKNNGIFIATTTDGDLVSNILNKGDFVTDIFQLKKIDVNSYTFNINTGKSESNTYFDVTGESREYFVFKSILVQTAKIYKLELVNTRSFYDWYKLYNHPMTQYEQLISFLNFSFVFKKVS